MPFHCSKYVHSVKLMKGTTPNGIEWGGICQQNARQIIKIEHVQVGEEVANILLVPSHIMPSSDLRVYKSIKNMTNHLKKSHTT